MQLFGFGGQVNQPVGSGWWFSRFDRDCWSIEIRVRTSKPNRRLGGPLHTDKLYVWTQALGVAMFWHLPARKRLLSLSGLRQVVNEDAKRSYDEAFAKEAKK